MTVTRTQPTWGLYVFFGQSFTGAPRVVVNLASALVELAFSTTVFTQKQSEMTEALDGISKVEIVALHPSLHQRGGAALREALWRRFFVLWHALRHNVAMYGRLRRANVDGLWVRNVRGVLICGMAARFRRIPLIWDIGMEKPVNSRSLALLYDFAFLISTAVVAEGQCVFDFVFSERQRLRFGGKMHVIKSGIPPQRVNEIVDAKRLRRSTPKLRLLCVATLCSRKNQMLLLKAMSNLDSSKFAVSFVGDDTVEKEYAAELVDYVRRNHLEDCVRFLGWRTDIPSLLSEHDVFVLTSRNEGVPYSVIEAMYSELPVVATAVGGLPDVVSHGETGVLTPDDDPDALATELQKLCENEQLRDDIKSKAYAYVSTNHTRESWTQGYAELLNRLTRDRRNVNPTNV